MKLSTRSRYGLRFMFELALHYNEGPLILKDIAAHQQISEKYLSKLVIPLRGAKLVNSARGMHGGYLLSRAPAEITVREVIEPLEGDLAPVDCTKSSGLCGFSPGCPTRTLWCKLDAAITQVLTENTLQSLVDDFRIAQQSGALMFQI